MLGISDILSKELNKSRRGEFLVALDIEMTFRVFVCIAALNPFIFEVLIERLDENKKFYTLKKTISGNGYPDSCI